MVTTVRPRCIVYGNELLQRIIATYYLRVAIALQRMLQRVVTRCCNMHLRVAIVLQRILQRVVTRYCNALQHSFVAIALQRMLQHVAICILLQHTISLQHAISFCIRSFCCNEVTFIWLTTCLGSYYQLYSGGGYHPAKKTMTGTMQMSKRNDDGEGNDCRLSPDKDYKI